MLSRYPKPDGGRRASRRIQVATTRAGWWSPYRLAVSVSTGLATTALVLSGVTASACAAQLRQPPASIGAGAHQTAARPTSVTDALRCARPARYVHFKKQRAVIAVAVG